MKHKKLAFALSVYSYSIYKQIDRYMLSKIQNTKQIIHQNITHSDQLFIAFVDNKEAFEKVYTSIDIRKDYLIVFKQENPTYYLGYEDILLIKQILDKHTNKKIQVYANGLYANCLLIEEALYNHHLDKMMIHNLSKDMTEYLEKDCLNKYPMTYPFNKIFIAHFYKKYTHRSIHKLQSLKLLNHLNLPILFIQDKDFASFYSIFPYFNQYQYEKELIVLNKTLLPSYQSILHDWFHE